MIYLDLQECHFVNPTTIRLILALAVSTAFREKFIIIQVPAEDVPRLSLQVRPRCTRYNKM